MDPNAKPDKEDSNMNNEADQIDEDDLSKGRQKRDRNRRASLFSRIEPNESGIIERPNIEEGKLPKKDLSQINEEFQREKELERSAGNAKKIPKTKIIFIVSLLTLIILAVITGILLFSSDKPRSSQHISGPDKTEEMAWYYERLPTFIEPKHYDLFMHPDLSNSTFSGNVSISFEVKEQKKFIVFHAANLTIDKTILKHNKQDLISDKKHHEEGYCFVKMIENLKLGQNYILQVSFKGKLKEKNEGIYYSSYNTSNGKKRVVVSTHFKRKNARKAFPCFDEPALKSTFTLKIVHAKSQTVYSNTDVKNTSAYDTDLSITEFQKTPSMSTYLIAFVICDYGQNQRDTKKGIKIRILAPSDHKNQTDMALDSAYDIFSYFTTTLNYKYPFKKLDIVAIPSLPVEGMYNWGLITCRMSSLYYSKKESDSDTHQRIVTVIAHEIAHQWFGTSVTMEWWDDEWVTEGLATYFQYSGVHSILPAWKMMDQFSVLTKHYALNKNDENAKAIYKNDRGHFKIDLLEDNQYSYEKFASVINMLRSAVNSKTIFEISRRFLENGVSYPVVSKEKLKQFLKDVSLNLNYPDLLDSWIYKDGFPLIYADYRPKEELLNLTQKTIIFSHVQYVDNSNFPNFLIPVTYISNSNSTRQTYWLNTTEGRISLSKKVLWIKLNVQSAGFYRVMYDEDLWKIIAKNLVKNHTIFSPADRSNLLDDAFTLANLDILEFKIAMSINSYMSKERDYLPWEMAIYHYIYLINKKFENVEDLKKNFSSLMEPFLSEKVDSKNHLKMKCYSRISYAKKLLNTKNFFTKNQRLHVSWKTNGKRLPRNLPTFAFNAGVKYGSISEWKNCWKIYYNAKIPPTTRLILQATSQTRLLWHLKKYLPNKLQTCKIRTADIETVVIALSENSIFGQEVWRILKTNFTKFVNICESSPFMSFLLTLTLSNFNEQSKYDEVNHYIPEIKSQRLKQEFVQVLEKMRNNMFWKNNVEPSVVQWVKNNVV